MYNFDNSIYRIIFILLRAGLNWTTIPRADWNECQKILKIDWGAIYKECVRHGVLAIAWDGLLRLVEENVIPSSKLPERRLKYSGELMSNELNNSMQNNGQLHLI